jgi:hypothetical protein
VKQYLTNNRNTVLLALLFIGIFNDWLLQPFTSSLLNPLTSTVSELSAHGQPNAQLHQFFDILAGLVIIVALPMIYRHVSKRHDKWGLLLVVSFGLIGLGTLIDGFLPIDCAPSVVAGCVLNDHSILNTIHLTESFITGVFTFIAPTLWWWFHREDKSLLSRSSYWFMILQVFLGMAVLIQKATNIEYYGFTQRLYLLGISYWITVVIVTALKSSNKK